MRLPDHLLLKYVLEHFASQFLILSEQTLQL
jgi:hypothetical protein